MPRVGGSVIISGRSLAVEPHCRVRRAITEGLWYAPPLGLCPGTHDMNAGSSLSLAPCDLVDLTSSLGLHAHSR